MMRHELRILVSGASVAGLSSAFWLARYGFDVTVVERARHLRAGRSGARCARAGFRGCRANGHPRHDS